MKDSEADIAIGVLNKLIDQELEAARAGRLRDMLQRYADGTLDFELVCPISLLSRQLDVMDEYANLLRRRARIEHVHLEK